MLAEAVEHVDCVLLRLSSWAETCGIVDDNVLPSSHIYGGNLNDRCFYKSSPKLLSIQFQLHCLICFQGRDVHV